MPVISVCPIYFPYLLNLTGNLHAYTMLHSHLASLVTSNIITCCYISCIDVCNVCMIVLEINILPQARYIYTNFKGLPGQVFVNSSQYSITSLSCFTIVGYRPVSPKTAKLDVHFCQSLDFVHSIGLQDFRIRSTKLFQILARLLSF